MSELLNLIQEADRVAFDLEMARAGIETAKQNLEVAKETFETTKKSYEELLSKADELGVPRPKIRKLMEERTMALVSSGLIFAEISSSSSAAKSSKAAKTPKANRKKSAAESDDEMTLPEVTEESVALM